MTTPPVMDSKSTPKKKSTILIFDGHQYDVTHFDHPGEGIRGVYLEEYNQQEISEQLDYYHSTNEPYELLEQAKILGQCDGIRYLGPVVAKCK